jgi:poly(3-hydroxybutyrate) depolymerase
MPTRCLALALLLTACTPGQPGARLRSHPGAVAANVVTSGVIHLNLRAPRDTLFYVPASAPETAPLVLYLHGATGDEQQGIWR